MAKTRKSFTKRFKVTKSGKIIRRPMGVDHFRTKRSPKNIRKKRKNTSLDYPLRIGY